MSRATDRKNPRWICSRQASIVFLALALLAVLGLSLNPRPESILGRFSVYDKAGHFVAYVVLAFLAVRVFHGKGALPYAIAIVSCASLGGAIELVQPFVGRSMELGDFLVDLGGAILGSVIAGVVSRMARGSATARPSQP